MPPLARRFSAGSALARVCVVLLLLVQVGVRAQDRAAIAGPVRDTAGLAAVPVSQMLPRMVLDLRRTAAQQAALEQYLMDVQTPGSGSYRQWVTPADVCAAVCAAGNERGGGAAVAGAGRLPGG